MRAGCTPSWRLVRGGRARRTTARTPMPPIGLRSSARSARPPCWPRPRAPRVRAASRGSPPAARARRRCRRRSRRCGECRAPAGRGFAERPAAAGRRRRARRRRRFTAPLHDDRLRGDAHDHGPRRGMGGLAVDCPPPTAGAPGTVMTMYTGWMPPELGALDAGGVDAGGGEGGLDGGRVVVPGATWVGLVDRAAEVWTGRGRRPACRQGRRRGRWSAPRCRCRARPPRGSLSSPVPACLLGAAGPPGRATRGA